MRNRNFAILLAVLVILVFIVARSIVAHKPINAVLESPSPFSATSQLSSTPVSHAVPNTKTGFPYSGTPDNHRPSNNSPVQFVMVKESSIEPLNHFRERFDVTCDGAPIMIDLGTGRVSPNGELRVLLNRKPLNITYGKPFEWSAEVEVVGGGIQKAIEGEAFIAPNRDYQSMIQYEVKPVNSDWSDGIRQMFYLRTASGKYGRIYLKLDAGYQPPPAVMFLESWLNPSGSRSVEYDPSKRAASKK